VHCYVLDVGGVTPEVQRHPASGKRRRELIHDAAGHPHEPGLHPLPQQRCLSRQQLDAGQAAADAAAASLQALERQAAAAGATVTSAEAGVRLARLCDAIYESARTGREVRPAGGRPEATAGGASGERLARSGSGERTRPEGTAGDDEAAGEVRR
jgi:hypothetical protein